jgi:uncharacterized cysteine cluster protein YcgN (CxxCxxCC family)
MSADDLPFWKTKTLAQMTRDEWESLCDGCGLCCLLKVEEEDTGQIYLTRLGCKLLDTKSCRCRDYANRHKRVRDCVTITADTAGDIAWLPQTCAYRLIAEGHDLKWWHPLVSGDTESVHRAGISASGWARSEKGVRKDAVFRYIIGEAG